MKTWIRIGMIVAAAAVSMGNGPASCSSAPNFSESYNVMDTTGEFLSDVLIDEDSIGVVSADILNMSERLGTWTNPLSELQVTGETEANRISVNGFFQDSDDDSILHELQLEGTGSDDDSDSLIDTIGLRATYRTYVNGALTEESSEDLTATRVIVPPPPPPLRGR